MHFPFSRVYLKSQSSQERIQISEEKRMQTKKTDVDK